MAIKILNATLLKNYRAFPFIRVLVVLLKKIPLTHANWVRTRRVLSSSLSCHIVSLSFLVRLGLSALRPRRATVSTIRLLFRFTLCLFPLVACICPILSPFVYLVLVHTALRVFSILIFYLSFSLSLSFSLTCFLPCLSSFICLLLFFTDCLVYLSPFTLTPFVSRFLFVSSLSRTNLYNLF